VDVRRKCGVLRLKTFSRALYFAPTVSTGCSLYAENVCELKGSLGTGVHRRAAHAG
jgi:hypothetical protein